MTTGWQRPTLTELIKRIVADLSSRLTGDPNKITRRSNTGIIGRTLAGAIHLVYGYLSWVADQIIIDQAEKEYLERWAAIWGITRDPAAPAQGDIDITGIDTTVMPAGTVWIRSDGVEFTTDSLETVVAGVITAALTATVAGLDGNTDAGLSFEIQTPIAGIDTPATVAAGGIDGGLNEQTDEELREELLFRLQEPPKAGSESDYVRWAKEVPGVTRAWAFALWMGPGTVGITFVRDGDPDIIPDAGEVQDVQDNIDLNRPVTATPTAFAPVENTIDMTIKLEPNTAAVQTQVEAEIDDYYKRFTPGDTVVISQLSEAISLAAGEDEHLIVSTNPVAVDGRIALAAAELPKRGVITYQAYP